MRKLALLFWFLALPLQAQYKTLNIAPFKGLDLSTPALQLDDQSLLQADNAWWLLNGGVSTRPGFTLVNSTSLGAEPPWLISRFYRPGIQPAFIVGHGSYLWKVSNDGGFANPDSIISYRVGSIDYTLGSNKIIGRNTKWVNSIQTGDSIISGVNRWQVVRILMDSVLHISANAGATATIQNYQAIPNFSGSAFGSFVQVNTQLIGGSERRGAIVIGESEVPTLLGAVAQGKVDRIKQSGVDCRLLVDLNGKYTPNVFAGYWIYLNGLVENEDAGGTRAVGQLNKIVSHTDSVFTLDAPTNGNVSIIGCPVPVYNKLFYSIYAPFFTFVDSGTVRRLTRNSANSSVIADLLRAAVDTMRYDLTAIEFLSGKLIGQQFDVSAAEILTGPPDSIQINLRSYETDIGAQLQAGDKYMLWQIGAAARHWLWYNNQLVAANSRLFPNQIRFSDAGTIHNFKPLNFRAIFEKTGTQITQVKDFNGDLAIWQEGDTWKIPGNNLATGQLIHALSGVGCPAPRSLVMSGTTAQWIGIQSGVPAAFIWGGGGLKFNVTGDPSVYAGGDLNQTSRQILPLMKGLNLANISKAAGGLWEDHYLLSVAESASTVPNKTYCYHIPTGRWSVANFAGSIFYNATSSPDSGQLYFGNRHIGKIFKFGGVESDTGSQIAMTLLTKDLGYRSPIYGSQLGPVELDFEKANTTDITLQVFKNLPPVSATTLTFGSGVSGYRTEQKTPRGIWAKSFRLKLSYTAAQGIKIYGLRAAYLPTGVP